MVLAHELQLVAAVLLILIGYTYRRPRWIVTATLYAGGEVVRRVRLASASAHDLGRAHRLAARMLGSSYRPADENFVTAAQLWPSLEPLPYVARTWDLTLPLLGLEDLLEGLERFSARIARLGRRRGTH